MREFLTLPLGKAAVEVKFQSGQPAVITGYASTWDTKADSFGDTLRRGSFLDSLKAHREAGTRPAMFFNHDPSLPCGKWTGMGEDNHGLRVEGELTPGSQVAAEVEAALRHQAVDGLSIGFRTTSAEPGKAQGVARVLTGVDLIEVSVVSLPAASFARVASIKGAEALDQRRELERWLRQSGGLSRREAEALTDKGFQAFVAARERRNGADPARDPRDEEMAAVIAMLAANAAEAWQAINPVSST